MTDLLLCLVVWRISSILVSEAAPFDLAARFRKRIGVYYDEYSHVQGRNELAKAFTCVWCLSVHIGWLVAFLHYRDWSFVVYGLAYSAGAVMVEAYVKRT